VHLLAGTLVISPMGNLAPRGLTTVGQRAAALVLGEPELRRTRWDSAKPLRPCSVGVRGGFYFVSGISPLRQST
jgi:hypothetical protein